MERAVAVQTKSTDGYGCEVGLVYLACDSVWPESLAPRAQHYVNKNLILILGHTYSLISRLKKVA